MDSPSNLSGSSFVGNAAKYQTAQQPAFNCLRPYVGPPDGPMLLPVDLLSPVFGYFIDDVGIGGRILPALQPSCRDVEAACQLCVEMSRFFACEDDRRVSLHGCFNEYFAPLVFQEEYSVRAASGRHYLADLAAVSRQQRLLAKVAVKNEAAECYFQGQRMYMAQLETSRGLLEGGSVCPALLLQLTGPNLRVCALASEFTLANRLAQPCVTCEPLTPTLSLLYNPRRPEDLLQARIPPMKMPPLFQLH